MRLGLEKRKFPTLKTQIVHPKIVFRSVNNNFCLEFFSATSLGELGSSDPRLYEILFLKGVLHDTTGCKPGYIVVKPLIKTTAVTLAVI